MIVLADSGPPISLSLVGRLQILPKLYGTVIVPVAVWDEVVEQGGGRHGIDVLRSSPWFQRREAPEPSAELARRLEGLDPGEREAIVLALHLRGNWLLIDERDGRRRAKAEGLRIKGTLGVLVEAKRQQQVALVGPIIDDLQRRGFRASTKVVQQALVEAGEVV